MSGNYDLAVTGTGTAASVAADRCRSVGRLPQPHMSSSR